MRFFQIHNLKSSRATLADCSAAIILFCLVITASFLSSCASNDDIPYPRATHADRGEDVTLSPAQQGKFARDLQTYVQKKEKSTLEAIKDSGEKDN